MTIKLTAETAVTLDNADMRAVLTDYICSGSYGPFADLIVTDVSQDESSGDFHLILNPKSQESE